MKIKNYMKKNPEVIEKGRSLKEAVEKMVEKKNNGLIVVESKDNMKPIGILSSLCVIKKVLPDYLEDYPEVSAFESDGQLACFSIKYKDEPVEEAMIKLRQMLHPDDTMVEAASYAVKSATRKIPVVDDDDRLVGVVDRTCIKNAIYDVFFKMKDLKCGPEECDLDEKK
jgi:CBS domain-containing protein